MTERPSGPSLFSELNSDTIERRLAALSPERRAVFEQLLRESRAKPAPIDAAARLSTSSAPLSYAQERLWFLEQLLPGTALFNLTSTARFISAVDATIMEGCINEIVRRHESLRTTFAQVDGEPHQVISPSLFVPLRTIDLTSLQPDRRRIEAARLVGEQNELPFDLERGPLLRAMLIGESATDHVVALAMHHIVSDGWSIGLFWEELSEIWDAYSRGAGHELPELSVQYRDFAIWERSASQGSRFLRLSAYWKRQLNNVQPLLLHTDRPRPPVPSGHGSAFSVKVAPETLAGLKAVGREQQSTLFMVLLTAFMVLLARYVGQTDIAVGTFTANRDRLETEGLIGFFVNTLVLRADLSGNPTLREALVRMRETAIGAYEHQDLPFPRLVQDLSPDRDLSRNQLFDVAFQLVEAEPETDASSTITPEAPEAERRSSPLDITVSTWECSDGLLVEFEYSTDLFDEASIARLSAYYRRTLEAFVSCLDQRLDEVDLLPVAERRQVTREWNKTMVVIDPSLTVTGLFAERVATGPDVRAVGDSSTWTTYRELDDQVNRLARQLVAHPEGREARIGVCLERSVDLFVALLAIFRIGAVYVPLDPGLPGDRLHHIVDDADIGLVVTQRRLVDRCAPLTSALVVIDDELVGTDPDLPLPTGAPHPDQVAALVYTSGSTGCPKGVGICHGQIMNRLQWMWRTYPFSGADVGCVRASIGFIDSLWELLGPLLRGVPTVLIPDDITRDPKGLVDRLAQASVTRIWVVPSMLRAILQSSQDLESRLPELLFWVSTGEPLAADLCQEFHERLPAAALYNLYGTSEVWDCTWHDTATDLATGRHVAIGCPIDNVEALILDGSHRPVPIMVPGELYVGGAVLPRGYVGRPDLTAECFVPHPFPSRPGARMYRTGDVARWLPDGSIDLLGRSDDQIKLRGYRIELGEIESVLREHPAVHDAAVVLRAVGSQEVGLVAFVTWSSTSISERQDSPAHELRRHLGRRLPDHMVPAQITTLAAIPMTGSGKVDRVALSAVAVAPPDLGERYAPPRSTVERELAAIWSQLLGIGRVGRGHNFFDAGGHSLLGVRLMARVRETFTVDLPLRTVFEAPTLAELAEAVESALEGDPAVASTGITPVSRSDRAAILLPGGELALSQPQAEERFG